MKMLLKTTVLPLILLTCAPAHGMWKNFLAKAAFNKKVIAATAATASAGLGYAKKDDFAHAVEDTRLDILNTGKLQTFRKIYPNCFHALVAEPLLRKIRYNSVTEYVQESEEATQRKQTMARALCIGGIPLGVTQTEADMLTFDDNRAKKAFIFQNTRRPFISLEHLDNMFQHEKDLQEKGFCILYHGTANKVYAVDYIGSQLQTIDQPNNQSFLALRQREDHSLWHKVTSFFKTTDAQEELKKEKEMREKLLTQQAFNYLNFNGSRVHFYADKANGRNILVYHDHDKQVRTYVLACTPVITNGTRWYMNHAYMESPLMATTSPRRDNMYDVGTLQFDTHSVPQNIVQKYTPRLVAAQKKFSAISSGTVMQIALSPALLNQTTYPALPAGFRHTVKTKKSPPQKFENPSEILIETRNNPFNVHVKHSEDNCSGIDPLQFRLVVDKSLLLDPNNPEVREGFKVKAFAANQEALDAFHAEVDTIVNEIRTEMHQLKAKGS